MLTYDGGCACGAIRYQSADPPVEAGYCHCRICQRSSSAPVLVFASFPVASFQYRRGEPNIFASSDHGHREFCNQCGTQIAYRDAQAAITVDVNVGSLDDPSAVAPEMHIWCDSRISWFDTHDSLPRYAQEKTKTDVQSGED